MKKLKIFLASSEELKEERKELADLVSNLNHILSRRDIFVDLVKWEYLDASMGELHKQEEYNAELRDCELCIVLYWTRFGMYTKTELDTAYSELKSGHNPRKLYVYFKFSENPSEDLRIFKESFPNEYGHFSTDFGNIDTLKAHFLLQFLDYMSNQLKVNEVIEIRDSQVTVNGQTSVKLANVPFTGNNEDCKRLLRDINEAKENLSYLTPENPLYSRIAQKLQDLEKELAQKENNLWESALWITGRSSTKQSERLQRAMDLFNSGDNKGAMAVLKEEEIDRDVQHNLHLIELGEEGKKGLKTNIDEYILRIKTLKNDMAEGWGEEVLSLHKKILELAGNIYGEDSLEVANSQDETAKDFYLLGKYSDALGMSQRALTTRLKLLGENHPSIAEMYRKIANSYMKIGHYERALEYSEKALHLGLSIFGDNHPDVATSYNTIGSVYGFLREHEKALDYKEKALKMRLPIFGEDHPDVATSYSNIGYAYGSLGKHEKALEYGEKALRIKLSIYSKNNDELAISYNNVGCEYGEIGNYSEALNNINKALQIWLSIFGENHPNVTFAYRNIGLQYRHLGNHTKALEFMEKSLRIRQSVLGTIHPEVAILYGDIAMEYSSLGDHKKAVEFREKALKMREAHFGEKNSEVAQSYNNAGYEYGELGDIKKELEYRTKALEIAQLIEDSNLEATFHNRVGTTYQRMSNIEQAREHFQHAAKLFKELGNDKEYKANLELCKSLAKGNES